MTAQEQPGRNAERHGPQEPGPWGSTGEFEGQTPFGVGEDSPMDEGSEETAVPPGRLGDRRAGEPVRDSRPAGRHGFGPVEPGRPIEAGPGAPPDPAPALRTFPNDTAGGDLPDNALEEATGMHPETRSPEG